MSNLSDIITAGGWPSTGTGSVVLSNSPSLTGVPLAPTAAPGTNTTQLATTAFTKALGDTKSPIAGPGSSQAFATGALTATTGGFSDTVTITKAASVLFLAGSSYSQVASSNTLYLDSGTGMPLVFRPNGSVEAGRFDSAGNLGIGCAPNAWGSARRAIQIADSAYFCGTTSSNYIQNIYYDGSNFRYITTGAGALIQQSAGYTSWYNVSSGSAGAVATLNLQMYLDATGKLGIGCTPSYKLHVQDGTAPEICIERTGTYASKYKLVSGWSAAGDFCLYDVVNSRAALLVNSAGDTNVQRGLAVGTYSAMGSTVFFASAVLSAGAGTYPLKWNSGTGIVTYDTSSRLVKENIVDSPYGLKDLLKLQPRKYFRTDDKRNEIGLIADEVVEVIPEVVPIVPKSLFTKNEEDTELIPGGVNYEKLVPLLISSIKELETRLAALETKLV